ncbi:ABC transporter permease [Pengzhenrongella frigida]|uniref:Polyketide antibiotic transporter n=1 Tax=Pengzhenrongella frigida TaxID=1259133 RepID=A0A4Q5N7R8_9MICO|nr:hypothetical protein [Cellulomonas sp. HLT2-17]RYV52631.1 hypothetical protein EUA98_02745 [Cellulomonas sp. HLT2-17]
MSGNRGTRWAVERLTIRLTRRSTLLASLALAGYAALEFRVIEATYPDDAARAALLTFGDFPLLRTMQGVPYSTESGALVAWDAGWMMSLVVGVWAITTTARILRGDEDDGRAEVTLAGPVRASRMLARQAAVLLASCAGVGLAVGLALITSGTPPVGALLFGATIWAVGGAFVGLTALTAQVFASRSRTLGVSTGLLGAALVLRMTANSTDSRSWLAWVTPLGWSDHVRPFGDNQALALLVPVLVVGGLVGCAIALRVRRDSRTGFVRERGERPSRAWGLTSPLAFAWRTSVGTLVTWAIALAGWGLATGALVPTMNDFVAADPAFQDVLAGMGMNVSDVTKGFVGMTATITGVALSVFAATRIGAARTEESSTRLDQIATRSVLRRHWLAGHIVLALASVILLAVVAGSSTWAVAAAMGSDLTLRDAMAAVLNTVPVAVVFGGLAVLLLGFAPRATVTVAATGAAVAYLLPIIGPALDCPDAVVGASPFWHLGAVPIDAVDLTAAVALVAIGAVFAVVGMLAFERRDLVGA